MGQVGWKGCGVGCRLGLVAWPVGWSLSPPLFYYFKTVSLSYFLFCLKPFQIVFI
jgi:hypothetical protein